MQGKVEIYTLTCPISNKVFYVGATTKGIKFRSRTGWNKLPTYKFLKSHGFAPYIEVIDTCTHENRDEVESSWVKKFIDCGNKMENTQYNYYHETAKTKIGKPLAGETKKKSYTVSLTESMKNRIVKKYGSLTKAIEPQDPKPN